MPALEVTDLHKAFGSIRAVDGISFTIEAGEIFGLLGPNGAGKSTTINIISTLLRADSGRVAIDGETASTSAAYKRRIGYVPQDVSLAEKLTARENLMLVGGLYDLRGPSLRRRVDETLEAMGLAGRGSDLVATFSGGMKRRLNIGAALLHEPDLLLMDEPTVGVDPQARAYIFEIIERLAERKCGVLYTTHYMEEAERLCRRTAIIDHGKILALGTIKELTDRLETKRDLFLEAEGLTGERVARLAARLGDLSWNLNNGTAHFSIGSATFSLLEAARAADEIGLRPSAIGVRKANLETVFLELTGRALRD